MKKPAFPAIVLFSLLLSLLLPSCTELWGELDNPADPAAPSWQGYETVKDPDAVAPVEAESGTVAYVPTLLAGKVAGATAYQFRVSATADPEAYLYQSAEVTANEYLPVDCFGLSTTTTYYWFVRAKADGTWGAWSRETATFSLSAAEPGQVWPMTGMTSSDTTPLLIWEDFPDAVSYLVQIAATEGGLTSAPEFSAAVSEYQTTETLAVGNTRWWRVCALNASSQQGPWTAAASFTIVPPPPPPLLTPADASSATSARPEFTWTAVDEAASYEIAIETSEAGLENATPVPVSGISWTPASDLAMGSWYWRVRCVDAYGATGDWSAAWSWVRSLLDMVSVAGGTFTQGRQVTLSDYAIGKYEVTFAQYDAFCVDTSRTLPSDSGWGRGTRPVINVSWYDAVTFCNWLSAEEGLPAAYSGSGTTWTLDRTKTGYRMPTEAEWEYAARGGASTHGYTYSGSNDLNAVAWYSSNSGSQTHAVGGKAANELGLYDMSGNGFLPMTV